LANLAHHAYAAELGSLRFIRGMICVLELVILLNILFIINKNCEDTIFDFIVCIDPYNVNSLALVTYLVTAYSLRPLWRLVAVNVPIQPRSRRLLPIFHVTN